VADTPTKTAPTTPADSSAPPDKAPDKGPGYWKVRNSLPSANKRTHFRTVSESRARQWLMNHAPRGEEMYLESPTGATESYSVVRHNEDGSDAESWQPFDPESFVPPGEMQPPGSAGWPDVEG
jgi:hypothetical protein